MRCGLWNYLVVAVVDFQFGILGRQEKQLLCEVVSLVIFIHVFF